MAGARIQLKRATASSWSSANPVLYAGEIGYETDTNKFKIGNGSTAYNSLPYFNGNLTGSSLNDLADVTIVSASNGDFLRWNGTAWINDAVNLSTDTVGNYMVDVVGGTGVTVSHTPGEGSTASVAIGQDVGTSASVSFGQLTVNGQTNIAGHVIPSTTETYDLGSASARFRDIYLSGTSINLGGAEITSDGTAITLSGGLNVDALSNIDSVQFDTTASVAPAAGMLTWDSVQGTLNLGLTANKHIHLGEESVFRVRNTTGAEIQKGTAVYASGVEEDGTVEVFPYVADGTIREESFIGLVTESITNGASGFAQTFGSVRGLDTRGTSATAISVGDETWAVGDLLYVHPTVAGKLTNVAPRHAVLVATLVIRNASTGVLLVRPSVGEHIQDLHDVLLTSPTDGQFLRYNSASTVWVNDTINLGTDTVGNYVSDVVAGTGVTVSHTPGEGSSASIAIGQDVATTASVTFAAVTAPLIGNASTATTLQTSRAISLAGDLSGSVSFNGSADVTITADIQPNSVALGTDTTGNFMSDVVAGTGVSITHTPGEGSSASIAIGQAVGTSDNPSFAGVTADNVRIGISNATEIDTVSGNLTIDSAGGTVTVDDDLVITGTLTVSGSATYVNTETLTVDDNVILLNSNQTGSPSQNAGIEIERGSSDNVELRWNETTDSWEITEDGTTYKNIAVGQDVETSSSVTFAHVTAPVSGNATTASALQTARAISLGGDLSGSASFDGSANITITADVQPNSVALGTDTTGNYVNDVVSGTGVTVTHTPGEGSSASIAIGQDVATTASVTFAAVTAPVIGNASTATTLQTARAISLAGDLSGSASFDGSANITITADVQPNSVALGTDTTGNYVNDITAGTGVTVSHTPGEGSSPTVSIGQAVGTSSSVTFAHVSADVTGALTGNASTATTLQTSRAISLAGDLSGSVSFNGGSDVTITAQVQPNSVALGTDTTGNYVSDVVAGTGISVTHTPGEGSSASVALNAWLNDLGDVVIAGSPERFQTLGYDGAGWVNSYAPVVSYVRNAEATTLTVGTVVYLFGGTGDHASVKRASNTSDTTSSKTVGVVGTAIAANENGPVITRGYASGMNLASYSEGDVLWLGTNGQFTTTKPSAPDHLVFVGVVVRATNNGIIYVATQNGYELEELHDVKINGVANGDYLRYNSASAIWVNDQINLGTDTVGNYMLDVSAGTGVTVSHTPGEGSTATISIPQSVATSASPTFAFLTLTGQPSQSTHAVTKAYADAIAAGINWHESVELATASILPNTPNYDNGTGGIDATLTASASARLIVDGINATTGDRILVKDQSNAVHNGIYDVTQQGSASVAWVLTRADDHDGHLDEVVRGDAVYVANGATNINQGFIINSLGTGTDNAHVIGTDSITFSQFTGAANIVAGTGVIKTGNILSIGQDVATSASVTFNTVSANLVGNASTATTLQNARTISLSGDVTGSVSFNGSANAEITATIAANSVALGTDTTGNYMSDLTAGTGVAITHTPGEGSNATIAIGQAVGTSSSVTFAHVSAPVTGNVTGNVTGDVTGNVTGNSGTATALQNARTISLGGDLSGSVSFNGTSDVTITAAVQPNSVALGTDTTGNYVSDVTAGTGINVTHTPGEGSNPTISNAGVLSINGNAGAITGVVTTADTGTVTSAMILDGTIANADINNSAAIAHSKLANATAGQVLLGTTTTGVVTATTVSGDVTIDGAGVTAIGAGVIVNADINSSAAIAHSKLANATAGQVLLGTTTTGVVTATTVSGDITINGAGVTAIGSGVIVNADVSNSAAIAHSKLANITAGSILMGNASNVPTATAMSGDVTITSGGVTAIGAGVIVNADVSNSAAISLSKLASGTSAQVIVANASGVPTYATLSGDITISDTGVVSIAANSVALGTDTTGNYVSDVTAGTGVTVTHTPGEGSSPTIAIGQAVGTSASVQFAQINTTGNVTIGGDLTVNGTTTTVNTETINLADNIIVLNSNETSTPSQNAGIEIERGSATNVALRWNEANDKWELTTDGSNYDNIATEDYVASLSPSTLDDLSNVTVPSPSNGQVLTYSTASSAWIAQDGAAAINALDDIGNVTAPTPSAGDFLKWNGSAWVNDAIDLGTDTTGNYVSGVVAGNLITVTHTPGEGSSASIAVTSGTAGQIIVANASGVPTWVSESGDVTIDSSGVASISSGVIVNADISNSAAIAHSKLANASAGQVLLGTTTTGVVTATTVSGDVTITGAGVTAIGAGVIVDADINAAAAISHSKLANITAGSILMGNASNVPTATSVSGDVTITSGGVTAIGAGVIVNADINASAAIDLGKLADISTNAQTASYTLVLADKNKIVEMNVGSANNLTVPLNSSVPFPVGSQINILQTGAGQTTIVATGGVTINATPGLKMRAQWSYATLIKRAENTWVLVGDISA